MSGDVLIWGEQLTVGYGSFILLDSVDFEVKRGDIFGILGGSGCGKSSLMRNMIGLVEPLGGYIHMAPGLERLGERRETDPPGFGVLFQFGALLGSLTLAENVALPLRTWTELSDEAIETVIHSKLRLVNLSGYENHFPNELSGGMQKRAGIARALALDPPLLYLDEPSAGLDPVSAVELDELILTLNRTLGMTMVIVTHELSSIFKIINRCIMLDKEAKAIIARGSPRQLKDYRDDKRVWSFFNRSAERE